MNTLKILKDAKSKAITEAVKAKTLNEIKEKAMWEQRRAYLDRKIEYFQSVENNTQAPKTVFISYSIDTGLPYYQHMKMKLEAEGFGVLNGFMHVENTQGNVIKKVINNLKKSTVYLGILTPDMELKGRDKLWSPSVWTVEEKGMAIGLEKPFILLIDKSVHTDFWLKTAANKQHVVYNGESDFYNEKADLAIQEINSRYEEHAIKFLQNY